MVFTQFLYMRYGKGLVLSSIEPDYAEIVVHARGNYSPIEKDEILKKVENTIIENQYIRNLYSRREQ